MKAILAIVLVSFGAALFSAAAIQDDETLVFYPAVAWPVKGGWRVDLKGMVYEAGEHPRQAAVFRKLLGIDGDELTADERRLFRTRIESFLVDNERGKKIQIEIGRHAFRSGKSGANGHFEAPFDLASNEAVVGGFSSTGGVLRLAVRVGASAGSIRELPVQIHLLQERGWSVISDVDDTIKLSNVRDKRALIHSTFCQPFKAVPGMATVYRDWAARGAQFHYVSASPWQLYPALSEFAASNRFPAGTFHMKSFRVKDASLVQLFGSQQQYKSRTIGELVGRFPDRAFVLVGDSGEQDPEIYGDLARRFPRQIRHVFIRNVTSEGREAVRYQRSFRQMPATAWTVFEDALVLSEFPQPDLFQ